MENGLILVVLAIWLKCSCGCDPDFCVSRPHGASFVDPTNPSFYYVCVWGDAQYLPCPGVQVFNGLICDNPDPGATTPNPATDTSTGTVVDGYCRAMTVTPVTTAETTIVAATTSTTASTSTSTSTTTSLSTVNQGIISWNLYRRHVNKKSACAVYKRITVPSAIACGTKCLCLGDCTDFNFPILTNDCDTYVCDLLTCSGDYLLSSSSEYHFYQRI